MMPERYPKQVFWSEEDDAFVALAPDLPGCSAIGASEAEALLELEGAIAAWIGAARAAGNSIPPASRLDGRGKLATARSR
jgi:predicted RNase H-like HicB family nuclease